MDKDLFVFDSSVSALNSLTMFFVCLIERL